MSFTIFINRFCWCLIITGIFSNSFAASFPKELLPPHIRNLTDVGQRCEWTMDGQAIAYVTSAGGEVRQTDANTGQTISISNGENGYYRVLVLPNGDYVVTKGLARNNAKLQILDKSLTKPATAFDLIIQEGPVVSRTALKIAYTSNMSNIYVADIVYNNGVPTLQNKKEVVNGMGSVEPQNFRPPLENELIFSCYGCASHEIYGVDLNTLKKINYSKADSSKEEPEGIYPSGKSTLFEGDKHDLCGDYCVDIYTMVLDGTGLNWTRLLAWQDVLNEFGQRFKSSNPAVRDDGKAFCFQEAISGEGPGVGQGIYIFDMEMAGIEDSVPYPDQFPGWGCMDNKADNFDSTATHQCEDCCSYLIPVGKAERLAKPWNVTHLKNGSFKFIVFEDLDAVINITNIEGSVIMSHSIGPSNQYIWTPAGLSAGSYLMTLQTNQGNYYQKVILK